MAIILSQIQAIKRRVTKPGVFASTVWMRTRSRWTIGPAGAHRRPGLLTGCLLACSLACMPAMSGAQDPTRQQYDADQALSTSQAAIGRALADLQFSNRYGQPVNLQDFKGRPLLISLVFTSCYHVCPAITRHLASAVSASRQALGEDSFTVLTIGFDTANDTAEAMRSFAAAQQIDDKDWHFLSADAQTMKELVSNLGFVYYPSPRGFDHINQVTVVDRDGQIYTQVYGAAFDLPWLMEPLKQLVYNQPRPGQHLVASLLDRVRLFCTVYDPASGRYRFDYSLFVQIAIGALVIGAVLTWLSLEALRGRRRRQSKG